MGSLPKLGFVWEPFVHYLAKSFCVCEQWSIFAYMSCIRFVMRLNSKHIFVEINSSDYKAWGCNPNIHLGWHKPCNDLGVSQKFLKALLPHYWGDLASAQAYGNLPKPPQEDMPGEFCQPKLARIAPNYTDKPTQLSTSFSIPFRCSKWMTKTTYL